MAELTINADEITAALKRYVDDYTPEVGTEQVGRIVVRPRRQLRRGQRDLDVLRLALGRAK